MFVKGKKFKVNDKNVNFSWQFFLGNISKKFHYVKSDEVFF